jgi:hypothetical protein
LQFFSILIILIWTPFGVFIYLLIRPPKTLFEKYYDEVEYNLDDLTKTIKSRLWETHNLTITCPSCNYPVDSNYKFCPNCKNDLKFECISCKKKIDKTWKICAHCWEKEPLKIEIINKESKKEEIKKENINNKNKKKKK